MSTPTPAQPRCPQLLLSVLGTDADRRLVLLIFAILSISLSIFFAEFVSLFFPHLPFLYCAEQSISSPEALTVGGLNFSCSWQIYVQMLLWLGLGLLLVFGLAFLIYWLLPIWKCWREGLQPLKEAEFADVINSIEELRETKEFGDARLASIHLRYVRNPLLRGSHPKSDAERRKSHLYR